MKSPRGASTNASTNNTLDAAAGDDTLFTGAGADQLCGGDGNDLLAGGADNDTLNGGLGNNTYLFDQGDGQDYLRSTNDASPNKLNVLRFNAAIAPAQVSVQRLGDSLVLSIAGTNDQITVQDFFWQDNPGNSWNPLQQVQFADGTRWDIATLTDRALSTSDAADTVRGTNGDDFLSGQGGADVLTSAAGNDTLIGGTGNDTLIGATGNDTCLLSRGTGQDRLIENDVTSGNLDTLAFASGILPSDVWFKQAARDLQVLLGKNDQMTIKDWVASAQGLTPNPAACIEQFEWSNQQVLLENQLTRLVEAMAGFAPPSSNTTSVSPTAVQAVWSSALAVNLTGMS